MTAMTAMTSMSATAQALVAPGKGLLAMDESVGTCDKRFASVGLQSGSEARRAYRELLVTTSGLGDCISGAILYDETLHQTTGDGTPLIQVLTAAGIIPGIKVDGGTVALAGHPAERVTEGLDGLRERLKAYGAMGMRFAKWRAVCSIGHDLPTAACIEANAHALARYAALCQEAGLVPIVEPEVLMDGDHTLARCQAVTDAVLHSVFEQLHTQGVALEAMVLKPNMVLPGLQCPTQASVTQDDRGHAGVPASCRAGGRGWHCFSVGWASQRTGFGSAQRHASARWPHIGVAALAADLFICTRASAASAAAVGAGPREPRRCSASAAAPSTLQQRCAAR